MTEHASTSADETVIDFDSNMQVEEDVNGCLERFVLLSKMGMVEEARDVAEDILWKYVRFFSVFAELCDFFIEIGDVESLTGVLLELAANQIIFEQKTEIAFVAMAAHFAKGTLHKDTLNLLENNSSGKDASPSLEPHLSEFQAEVHDVELRLRCEVKRLAAEQKTDVRHEKLFSLCTAWISLWCKNGNHCSSSELFKILATIPWVQQSQKDSLYALYDEFREKLPPLEKSALSAEDQGLRLVLSKRSMIKAQHSLIMPVGEARELKEELDQLEENLQVVLDEPDGFGEVSTDEQSKQTFEPYQPEGVGSVQKNVTKNQLLTVSEDKASIQTKQNPSRKEGQRNVTEQTRGDVHMHEPKTQALMNQDHGSIRAMGNDRRSTLLEDKKDILLQDVQGMVSMNNCESNVVLNNLRGRLSMYDCESSVALHDIRGRVSMDDCDSDLALQDVRGRLSMNNCDSSVALHEVRGRVSMNKCDSNVALYNIRGRVSMNKCDSSVTFLNIRGNVSLAEIAGDLTIHDLHGNISISQADQYLQLSTSKSGLDLKYCEIPQYIESSSQTCFITNPTAGVEIRHSSSDIHILNCSGTVHLHSSAVEVNFHDTLYEAPKAPGLISQKFYTASKSRALQGYLSGSSFGKVDASERGSVATGDNFTTRYQPASQKTAMGYERQGRESVDAKQRSDRIGISSDRIKRPIH